MSARKISNVDVFEPVTVQSRTSQVEVPASAVRVHKSGIEFRSATPIPVWTEMTVGLQAPADARRVQFSGVVVACQGDRHRGYKVSLVFTSVSARAQARLSAMVSN
ncbi:MAG TPA: PilZ domain-containing protein [Methylomirabilota bacterium]|nr:PilZ domain-containing protein [Methylomirabilota bacterium]